MLFLYVENEEEACFHGTPRLSSTIRERLLIDQERKGGKKRGLDLRAKGIYIYISCIAIESDFSFSLLRSDNTSGIGEA